jgi:hypothetical protein
LAPFLSQLKVAAAIQGHEGNLQSFTVFIKGAYGPRAPPQKQNIV